jgi:uncharacterized membrane protein
MNDKTRKESFEIMNKDPNNWKGIFYVNRKDSRIIVPKINPSMGWTLNFGSVYAYLGLVAIISIIITLNLFV